MVFVALSVKTRAFFGQLFSLKIVNIGRTNAIHKIKLEN